MEGGAILRRLRPTWLFGRISELQAGSSLRQGYRLAGAARPSSGLAGGDARGCEQSFALGQTLLQKQLLGFGSG